MNARQTLVKTKQVAMMKWDTMNVIAMNIGLEQTANNVRNEHISL